MRLTKYERMENMKKTLCLLLTFLMLLSFVTAFASDDVRLKITDASDYAENFKKDVSGLLGGSVFDWFCFEDVNLSGVKSIGIKADVNFRGNGGTNGFDIAVILDDYKTGTVLGYIHLDDDGEIERYTSVSGVSGTHDVYFYFLTGGAEKPSAFKEVIFSANEYKHDNQSMKVPDSAIIDNYSDTWAATDDFGRAVASFEEAGAVKEGTHEVGMLYWNWHVNEGPATQGGSIPAVIKNNPGAEGNFVHEAWILNARYYWQEPLFGFYDSYDYWVYRRHAEMLSDAGIDAIFFDYTNGGANYISTLNVLAKAFRDAKATGVDIPRISAFTSMGQANSNAYNNLVSLYLNCFVNNDYSDIWYYMDGRPMLFGNAVPSRAKGYITDGSEIAKSIVKETEGFFTYKEMGIRSDKTNRGREYWMWLEHYPQVLRGGFADDGRPGFLSVGSALNESTIYGLNTTGVFSDQYSKGRAYTEAFGEDYTERGMRDGYFFREQAGLALDVDPEFVMIDGWNEWTTIRFDVYGKYSGLVFVDTYNDENSRDFEPARGPLKDDCYNMLCDFVRKYKGVRPVPTLSGAKTIDIAGDLSQWNEVGPLYVRNYNDYERNEDGLGIFGSARETHHFETDVINAIKGAKVSFDNDNFYFLVNAENAVTKHDKGFMTLYLNTDRNAATGWEGYDYAVNLEGESVISKNVGNTWKWEKAGEAKSNINGESYILSVPKSVIGETETVDFEFKWTDAVKPEGDLLTFYSEGSVAPPGRFNYVYTTVSETTLTADERKPLIKSETSVLKAGSSKAVVKGAKMRVYEEDITVAPFMENGTLYIPEQVYNEVMGYGRSKTEYVSSYNRFFTYHSELDEKKENIINNSFTTCELDSLDVIIDGREAKLSNPVTYRNGIFYIPASFIAECYGWNVADLGNGTFVISKGAPDMNAVNTALSHLN